MTLLSWEPSWVNIKNGKGFTGISLLQKGGFFENKPAVSIKMSAILSDAVCDMNIDSLSPVIGKKDEGPKKAGTLYLHTLCQEKTQQSPV